ncbi:hypothetical protein [Undibacterium sp. TC9W]|uniref:hypothetical protein n=1 Tax=Undibacterium sp. TC9W TaxID=3413053 RepID=UPI003BEFF1DA
MTDTTVKYFHSEMPGAPTLTGTPGSQIAVLDACLINGFGLVSVTSAVVAGNVATLNVGAGHSFTVGTVALVAGVTSPAELNGEARVTSITANSISFATAGISNQTATGTITAKLAGAGWLKPFNATSTAAYKSADGASSGCYCRIDDTNATMTRVVGYESMSDINTGTGQFPTNNQLAGGYYWQKSVFADNTQVKWLVFADARAFYLVRYPAMSSYPGVAEITYFGDIVPTKSGDAYACGITGNAYSHPGQFQATAAQLMYSAVAGAEFYCARSYSGLGSAVQMGRTFPLMYSDTNVYSGAVPSATSFPNPADGGVYAVNFNLVEFGSKAYRGVLPGALAIPQSNAYTILANKDLIVGQGDLAGRSLRAVTSTGYLNAAMFFDVTGPWR